jgi:predicted RNA-binding protein with PUA-like domain
MEQEQPPKCPLTSILKVSHFLWRFTGSSVQKFIVPIRPEYHNKLFTTFPGRQTATLFEYAGNFIVEGNSITKAYICHTQTKRIRPGDVLFFYLSGYQELTSLGVVEVFYTNVQDVDQIIWLVGKRTVYSKKEIIELATKPCAIILFRHHFYLRQLLSLKQLRSLEVLAAPPQSIVQIKQDAYASVRTEGKIDERFTIH